MLYCLKHKVFDYRNRHKCSRLELITITKECKPIADGLYDLIGAGPLSVAHFITPVIGSLFEHNINLYIDLPKDYPISLLGDLPSKWITHTETVSDDHLPILVVSYSETFRYEGGQTVNGRVKEIIKEFMDYLGTRDPQSTKSVITLMYS